MTLAKSALHPEHEIEGLLTALNGVLAARVAVSALGSVEEVHVLSDPSMHPKQMVRNIESALSAGLGIIVDRRAISVAQVRADDAEAYVSEQSDPDDADARTADQRTDTRSDGTDETMLPTATSELPAAPATATAAGATDASRTAVTGSTEQPDKSAAGGDAAAGRFIFMGYDARTQPDLETACRVTLRRDNDVFSGTGSGPSTPLGRAQAAARAVFGAIAVARRSQSLDLEGVTLVDSHGRGYVLVAAHAVHGRHTVPLTGIAALQRSPEEAAILASLQAINRWNEFDG
jgi:hypothetical protein